MLQLSSMNRRHEEAIYRRDQIVAGAARYFDAGVELHICRQCHRYLMPAGRRPRCWRFAITPAGNRDDYARIHAYHLEMNERDDMISGIADFGGDDATNFISMTSDRHADNSSPLHSRCGGFDFMSRRGRHRR